MSLVRVRDKQFEVSITEERIRTRIKEIAAQINADYEGKQPLFLAVLNREITIPSEISFVKIASYSGVETTGVVNDVIGLNCSIEDRHVVIVEDIVDF